MRFKAVVFLLTLIVGDCTLWRWSIAGEHDMVALAAGLLIVPLVALGLGVLLLTCARLLTRSARHSSRRSARASRPAAADSRPSAERRSTSSAAATGLRAGEADARGPKRLAA